MAPAAVSLYIRFFIFVDLPPFFFRCTLFTVIVIVLAIVKFEVLLREEKPHPHTFLRRSCCLCFFLSFYLSFVGIDFKEGKIIRARQKKSYLGELIVIFDGESPFLISPLIINCLYLEVLDAKNRVFSLFCDQT